MATTTPSPEAHHTPLDGSAEQHATAPERPSRVYYFDYLRTWATLGVVLLHSSATVYTVSSRKHVDLLSHFTIADVGDSLGRFGVNTFFMISGALLLAPGHRFRLRKQALRVAVPVFVWSLVYLGANTLFSENGEPRVGGARHGAHSWWSSILYALVHPVAYHLWFVYVLVGIYLVVPILRPLTALPDPARRRLLQYALVLWLVAVVAIPAAYHLRPGTPTVYAGLFPTVPATYVGVVLLGFYLHHYEIRILGRALSRTVLVAGALLGLGVTVVATYLEQTLRNGSDWTLQNTTPQVALYAACVFLLGKTLMDRPGRWYPFVALFSRLSYRIYLVHALVLHWLIKISPLSDWYLRDPLFSIPTMLVLTITITFAIAWLVDQIRPIRNYV